MENSNETIIIKKGEVTRSSHYNYLSIIYLIILVIIGLLAIKYL